MTKEAAAFNTSFSEAILEAVNALKFESDPRKLSGTIVWVICAFLAYEKFHENILLSNAGRKISLYKSKGGGYIFVNLCAFTIWGLSWINL